MEEEDEWHLFFECGDIREAWEVAGLGDMLPTNANNNHTICDFIFDTCRRNSAAALGQLAVLMWCIWLNRNNQVWNNDKIDARQIGLQAKHMWAEWAMVNCLLNEQHGHNQQEMQPGDEQKWKKPPEGVFKCNVDASFFNANLASGWGWCVRDYEGRFIRAGTDLVHTHLNTHEGEAMAVLKAMQHMIQRDYAKVIFESDSKLVVDAIHSNNDGISEFSILIAKIKSLVVTQPNFEVKFIRRQAIMVAHLLARAAYSIASCRVFDYIPPCIATQLSIEMN